MLFAQHQEELVAAFGGWIRRKRCRDGPRTPRPIKMVTKDIPMLATKKTDVNHRPAYAYVHPAYTAGRATWISASTG